MAVACPINLVITGANGMLGHALVKHFQANSAYRVFATTRRQLDFSQSPQTIITTLNTLLATQWRAHPPTAIIHAAAYTQVDGAEHEPALAMAVNGEGTRQLTLWAAQHQIAVIYISTDYVFDGCKTTPYLTTDTPNPLGSYGRSKLAGEEAVLAANAQHMQHTVKNTIVRTSWLYGHEPNGSVTTQKFVPFVLNAAKQQRPVQIIADQWGSPSATQTVASALQQLIESPQDALTSSIYHVCDAGVVSRYEQALEICRLAGLDASYITPVSSTQFEQPAPRPRYSALDTHPLCFAPWQTAFAAYWAEIQPQAVTGSLS